MNEFLRKSIQVYVYLGIWPIAESSKFFKKLRYAFGLIPVITIAVSNTLEYIDLFMQLGHWESFFENLPLSFVTTITVVKAYVFCSRRDEIVSLAKDMDSYVNELLLEKNYEKITILHDFQKRVQQINNFLWIVTAFCTVFVFTYPALTIFLTRDYSRRPLPLQAYFPFGLNATGNYVTAYLSEAVVGAGTAIHAITFDTFFIACILFGIARLRILQSSIERVSIVARKKSETNPEDCLITTTTLEEKFQMNSGTELKKCVQEHQAIIAFCKTVDSMLSYVLFVIFLSYGVIFCSVGFYAILIGPSMDVFSIGQVVLVLLAQIFLYFWYGNELMTESLKVADSALKCDWYDFGKRNTKTITFIMFRAQKPILLSVGKFHTVTLQTLFSLLNMSYSYFALLKRLYD